LLYRELLRLRETGENRGERERGVLERAYLELAPTEY